jgi:hypothetical protein
MFASRRGSLTAPVIKHGKFVLSFYSILINVCMYRKWCEGVSDTTALETSHQFYARPKSGTVRAFISAVDSFRYRQLHQRSATNVVPVSRSFPGFLHGWTHCTSPSLRCTVDKSTVEVHCWDFLRYNKKPNMTTISEIKPKLHINWLDGLVPKSDPQPIQALSTTVL